MSSYVGKAELDRCYGRLIDTTWKIKNLELTQQLAKLQKLENKLIRQIGSLNVVDRIESQNRIIDHVLATVGDLEELVAEVNVQFETAKHEVLTSCVIVPRLMARIENLEKANREIDAKIKNFPTHATRIKQTQDGTLTWVIHNAELRIHQARAGVETFIDSPVFYTNIRGYRMKLRLYLNGNGEGSGSHVSVYLVLLKGHYDALLDWPFKQKVTFTLMCPDDETNNISQTFIPDPASSCFQRPITEMNRPSGISCFIPRSALDMPSRFVKRYTMYLRSVVDNNHYKP